MKEEKDEDGDHGAAGQNCPADLAVTEEEKGAIRQFLDGGAAQQPRGRGRMIIWALKLAATLLLATGVAIAVGDGNEFDGVDCGVAAKPPNFSKGHGDRPSNGQRPGPGGPSSASGLGAVLADLPLHFFSVLADGHREVVKAVEAAMQRFEGKLDAVASGNLQLLKENGELRALHRDGFFKFALRVDPEDFRAFAAIMALGNRKAAAEALELTVRTFYERVERWNLGGAEYQRMARLAGWRKRVGRRIKLRLEDSVQSGEPNDDAENPVTVGAVLESIATADTQDYPAILRQVMETLEAQNPGNWAEVRQELVEMIKEEVG